MGLTKRGQGARAIAEGWTEKNGKLPVNPSGELKAKGHPVGATGVSMHVLSAMQLTGQAGDMQVKDARLGGLFNMGGAAVRPEERSVGKECVVTGRSRGSRYPEKKTNKKK